jgi:hypothetical protein
VVERCIGIQGAVEKLGEKKTEKTLDLSTVVTT